MSVVLGSKGYSLETCHGDDAEMHEVARTCLRFYRVNVSNTVTVGNAGGKYQR